MTVYSSSVRDEQCILKPPVFLVIHGEDCGECWAVSWGLGLVCSLFSSSLVFADTLSCPSSAGALPG